MGRHPKFLEENGMFVCLVCQEVSEKCRDNQVVCSKTNCKKAYDRITKYVLRNNKKFK